MYNHCHKHLSYPCTTKLQISIFRKNTTNKTNCKHVEFALWVVTDTYYVIADSNEGVSEIYGYTVHINLHQI